MLLQVVLSKGSSVQCNLLRPTIASVSPQSKSNLCFFYRWRLDNLSIYSFKSHVQVRRRSWPKPRSGQNCESRFGRAKITPFQIHRQREVDRLKERIPSTRTQSWLGGNQAEYHHTYRMSCRLLWRAVSPK